MEKWWGKRIFVFRLMYAIRPFAIFFSRVHERILLLFLNNDSGYSVPILQQISNISILRDRVVGIIYDISLILCMWHVSIFQEFGEVILIYFKQWRRGENTGRIRTRITNVFFFKYKISWQNYKCTKWSIILLVNIWGGEKIKL